MAMKFLSATQDSNGFHYSIWLDTTKFQMEIDENGQEVATTNPDPVFVRNYDWAPMPTGFSGGATAYQNMTLAEVKLLAAAELANLETPATPPTTLSVEGQSF